MITKEKIKKIEKLSDELRPLLMEVFIDLSIPKTNYKKNWIYAYDRRSTMARSVKQTTDLLEIISPWYLSRGLVNIEVRKNEYEI